MNSRMWSARLAGVVMACAGGVERVGAQPAGAAGPARLVEASARPVPDLVFVSRQIPDRGSIYWSEPRDMPGVGPHSRVRVAAPGRLLVRTAAGVVRVLVDGSQPRPGSLNLIDVNAPAVSYDGEWVVFAGLPVGSYDTGPATNPGAWRLYVIGADGSGLRQLTFSDQGDLDYARFGGAAGVLRAYDDYDPVWLPDGRVCFSSTRYPTVGHYSGVRGSNLFIVNVDGSRLHRITSERNGADRAAVDPLTGRIVYARWWRNHRFAVDDMTTLVHGAQYPPGGYDRHLGLTTDRTDHAGGADNLFTNFWQIATINPDGGDVRMFSGRFRDQAGNHAYGGAFARDGAFYANFFPMYNMTEAAGFGGIRRYTPGPAPYADIAGITSLTLEYRSYSPVSYGIFEGDYAGEPEVLADGRVVISHAPDHLQDYGLAVVRVDGTGLTPLLDYAGTTELRARVLAPRPRPPVAPDVYRDDPSRPLPSRLPPPAAGPYDGDGRFTFDALNVYFNAPVDTDIISAPPVGSAGTIRFFIDHQRTSPGSFPNLDWPVLLKEEAVAADGSVRIDDAPANVPLFEQLRTPPPAYAVPLTGGPSTDGAAHVTGMNFAPAGAVAACVGCHAGHTQIALPTREAARWTNLAPGAALVVSSERDPDYTSGLIDRRVMKGPIWASWNSAPGQPQDGQWVRLVFPVPVTVRTVRLYNPRFGDEAASTIQVQASTVRLFADEGATVLLAQQAAGPLAVTGTDVAFGDIRARAVEVRLDDVSGRFYGIPLAALAEVEVIARGEAGR